MKLTPEIVREVLDNFWARCEEARLCGISLRDAVDGKEVPAGWVLDEETCYYLPPNFHFGQTSVAKN